MKPSSTLVAKRAKCTAKAALVSGGSTSAAMPVSKLRESHGAGDGKNYRRALLNMPLAFHLHIFDSLAARAFNPARNHSALQVGPQRWREYPSKSFRRLRFNVISESKQGSFLRPLKFTVSGDRFLDKSPVGLDFCSYV
jgi:hypothetical protein